MDEMRWNKKAATIIITCIGRDDGKQEEMIHNF
jgi:hypothetical protein